MKKIFLTLFLVQLLIKPVYSQEMNKMSQWVKEQSCELFRHFDQDDEKYTKGFAQVRIEGLPVFLYILQDGKVSDYIKKENPDSFVYTLFVKYNKFSTPNWESFFNEMENNESWKKVFSYLTSKNPGRFGKLYHIYAKCLPEALNDENWSYFYKQIASNSDFDIEKFNKSPIGSYNVESGKGLGNVMALLRTNILSFCEENVVAREPVSKKNKKEIVQHVVKINNPHQVLMLNLLNVTLSENCLPLSFVMGITQTLLTKFPENERFEDFKDYASGNFFSNIVVSKSNSDYSVLLLRAIISQLVKNNSPLNGLELADRKNPGNLWLFAAKYKDTSLFTQCLLMSKKHNLDIRNREDIQFIIDNPEEFNCELENIFSIGIL